MSFFIVFAIIVAIASVRVFDQKFYDQVTTEIKNLVKRNSK